MAHVREYVWSNRERLYWGYVYLVMFLSCLNDLIRSTLHMMLTITYLSLFELLRNKDLDRV